MKLKNYCISLGLLSLAAACAPAQTPGVLTIAEPVKLTMPRSGESVQVLKLQLKPGYHVNSNTPNDDYLIPLKLTWDNPNVELVAVEYPKPTLEKSDFSEKPLSVFTGAFELKTRFKRSAKAMPGPGFLNGKLRYQACNEKMCLPPKTIDVKVPLLVD